MSELSMKDLQNRKLLSDEVGTIASIISKDKKIRKSRLFKSLHCNYMKVTLKLVQLKEDYYIE